MPMEERRRAAPRGARNDPGGVRQSLPEERAEPPDHRARFARALTRSVFGRDYWDSEHAEEVRRSLARKEKPR
jgi:hypothetical protein